MSSRSAAPDVRQLTLFGPVADEPQARAPAVSPFAPPALAPAPPVPATSPTSPTSPTPAEFRHPQGQRDIHLGEHRVRYQLRRSRRRSIGFVVGPDGLSVSAPRWVGLAEIEAALQAKAGWVLRKLHDQADRARRMEAARIEWRDGAELPFIGESLILVLDPRCNGVVLDPPAQALPGIARRLLRIGLPQGATPAQVRDAVHGWLQGQARHLFAERCALYAARLGVRMTRLSLSSAATRWGSASADGSIRLHWRLVHLPLASIDYVVAHELAHLREMNHSAAFWEVVRSVMPDFEDARLALRQHTLPSLD